MNHTIETVSGKFVDVLNPNPDDILIEDIAWALSRISRFAGHTITEIPYNVGQHSIFVASMVVDEPIVKMFALLHDSAESFICDVPSPVKHIPGVKERIDEIETNLLHCIFKKFAGRLPTDAEWKIVKHYDKRAQFIEAHNYMISRGRGWIDRDKHDISFIDLQKFPNPKTSIDVYEEFMNEYAELKSYLDS